MEEFQKYFFQTTFHHHFQARNAKISPIFHFDQGHNGRICHILCVNLDCFEMHIVLFRTQVYRFVNFMFRFLRIRSKLGKIACIVLWARVVGKLELQDQNPIPRREPKLLLPHNFIYFMQGPWDTLETVQSTQFQQTLK